VGAVGDGDVVAAAAAAVAATTAAAAAAGVEVVGTRSAAAAAVAAAVVMTKVGAMSRWEAVVEVVEGRGGGNENGDGGARWRRRLV